MAQEQQVVVTIVKVRLRDGGSLEARARATDLGELHRMLDEAQFIRLGDNTIVRCEDVRSIQLREEKARQPLQTPVERGRRRQPRLQQLIETKPFFLTSEFALALAAWIGLAIATAASDMLDATDFWLLTIAIAAVYGISRGFAKARTPSMSWDPREDLGTSR